jgi:Polyketide cyclase / dehydrase and lipid transport
VGRYEFSTFVAAPPEQVFDLWIDLDRMPDWVEGVSRITDVSGPVDRAGTSYTVWFGRMASRISEWAAVERVTGIEPAPPAWKAGALPLSYTRRGFVILASPRRTLDGHDLRGMAQLGSASALGAEGPRFKSGYPDTTVVANRPGERRVDAVRRDGDGQLP